MIDVLSASSEHSHEALRGGSGCRQHRPVDLERPLRSLSARPLVSAVMGGSDRDATPDDEHCVSVDVHTEASGADGVALRGSAVRHHVSDPSDGDMDQAEQPRHYSSTNHDDESEYDVGHAAASTVPFSDVEPRSVLWSRSDCTGYQFVTELLTSSASSCTTSTVESLSVIWPTLCSIPPPERRGRAPACALSLKQTATPHLGCAPSSESGLSPSLAQHHGTLSLLNYAPSLTS